MGITEILDILGRLLEVSRFGRFRSFRDDAMGKRERRRLAGKVISLIQKSDLVVT